MSTRGGNGAGKNGAHNGGAKKGGKGLDWQAIKDQLNDLHWPIDYPGHDTESRNVVLSNSRLMLHVHQHDNAPFVAPQRIAIAAAYHMPVVSAPISEFSQHWPAMCWQAADNRSQLDVVDSMGVQPPQHRASVFSHPD